MSSLTKQFFIIILCFVIIHYSVLSLYVKKVKEEQDEGYSIIGNLRRGLISSNCIMIERGLMPPYQKCFGCVVEDAVACIQDMRTNASGNVAPECKLNNINEVPDSGCCPRRIGRDPDYNVDIGRLYSAYPEALECLKRVNCEESLEYEVILDECNRACPPDDPLYQYPNGDPLCGPFWDAAYKSSINFNLIFILQSLVIIISTSLFYL